MYYTTIILSQNSDEYINGKVVIITGSNTGIGFETAKELSRRGARVFMACRNLTKAENAKNEILSLFPHAKLIVRYMDLSSLQSVRNFCLNFTTEERRLDILINNAGIIENQNILSNDGFELMFQTNHLGHFLLTNILIPKMRVFGGRILIVSSMVHFLVINVNEDIHPDRNFDPVQSYAKSKLYNILFMKELFRRLFITGLYEKISVNALHPGFVNTSLYKNVIDNNNVLHQLIFPGILYTFKKPREGAEASIYLSSSPNLEGVSGFFWDSDKTRTPSSYLTQDLELTRKIWDTSQNLVKLKPSENYLD